MLTRTLYDYALAVARPTRLRDRNLLRPRQVLPSQRFLALLDVLDRALCHELAAVDASAWTDIDDVIRCVHRVLVVLNHDQSIADVRQMSQRPK